MAIGDYTWFTRDYDGPHRIGTPFSTNRVRPAWHLAR